MNHVELHDDIVAGLRDACADTVERRFAVDQQLGLVSPQKMAVGEMFQGFVFGYACFQARVGLFQVAADFIQQRIDLFSAFVISVFKALKLAAAEYPVSRYCQERESHQRQAPGQRPLGRARRHGGRHR